MKSSLIFVRYLLPARLIAGSKLEQFWSDQNDSRRRGAVVEQRISCKRVCFYASPASSKENKSLTKSEKDRLFNRR